MIRQFEVGDLVTFVSRDVEIEGTITNIYSHANGTYAQIIPIPDNGTFWDVWLELLNPKFIRSGPKRI